MLLRCCSPNFEHTVALYQHLYIYQHLYEYTHTCTCKYRHTYIIYIQYINIYYMTYILYMYIYNIYILTYACVCVCMYNVYIIHVYNIHIYERLHQHLQLTPFSFFLEEPPILFIPARSAYTFLLLTLSQLLFEGHDI